MVSDSTSERDGHKKGGGGKKEKKVTSRRIHSARDLANENIRNALGVLDGSIGTKQGTVAVRKFREARVLLLEGQKVGYEKRVFDVDHPARDLYAEQESAILAEMEAQKAEMDAKQAEAEVKRLQMEAKLKRLREKRDAETLDD